MEKLQIEAELMLLKDVTARLLANLSVTENRPLDHIHHGLLVHYLGPLAKQPESAARTAVEQAFVAAAKDLIERAKHWLPEG
ncbi:hypothetical protein [Hydrocarboniphaga sp.]|uniref:hypothetical protein n=1 Tax=Hydrocarboniphaga sp. TaxID=2033016 RepID=UPI003D0EA3E4